jgi:branched-chain amino acid transport system ATP-binding protein
MLSINNLSVSYGHVQALENVDIEVPQGQIVSIIGANGAGKSTLLNTISGLVPSRGGTMTYHGKLLPTRAHRIVQLGIVQVPEGRNVFAGLTVRENLIMGGYLIRGRAATEKKIERMFELFPQLRARKTQQAGTLSGGEQQMLAICRGLMSDPKLILLDEPSLGLAPVLVNEVFKLIANIKQMGITVLLVEQNAVKALSLSDYSYVLENGRIGHHCSGVDMLCNADIKKAYLGETVKECRP